MNGRDAYNIVSIKRDDAGRFYGPTEGISLGVGLFINELNYPLYLEEEGGFAVVQGLVYILSHECDIDQSNQRPFNDYAVVCPVIPLSAAAEMYGEDHGDDQARAFFDALGSHEIDRLVYIPPIADHLPFGGMLYFGMLVSTAVAELARDGTLKCAALSSHGLRIVDNAIEKAFRRPKAESLALTH